MNSEAWMLGCQLMNQSVENGSMPLGGETPLTSLYSLSSRSRDSVVSASSSCRRAPCWMRSIASWVWRASETRLLPAMIGLPSGCDLLGLLAGHQHRRVRRCHDLVLDVAREHFAEDPVVEAEPAQQHVAARDLDQLRRGERLDQVGGVLGDAETEQRRRLVVLDHPLREQQVGE